MEPKQYIHKECENEICYATSKREKALFRYEGKMKLCMYRFKYANRREYARYFAKVARIRYGDWIEAEDFDQIIPVPMYKKKQRKRGYNQAEVFAKALSKEFKIPLETHAIYRVKNTKPLKGLDENGRKNNLKNAFQIDQNKVKLKKTLLVDDIYTTGSTKEAICALTDPENMAFLGISIVE